MLEKPGWQYLAGEDLRWIKFCVKSIKASQGFTYILNPRFISFSNYLDFE